MAVKFSNNAATTLAANVSTSDTSISVSDGSVFPSISGGHYTYVTLEDINANREIVKVTAISSNTLTVVRGQDGTSARAFSSADKCELRITAALLNDVASQADTDTNTTYSASSGITLTGTTFSLTDKSDYDTAFGWGNHASAGYLTSHQSLSGYATETYVGTQVSNLVDSSPATLNTLNELAAALGDDPNFATTVSTSIGTKLPLAGGTLTGGLLGTTGSFSGSVTSTGLVVNGGGNRSYFNLSHPRLSDGYKLEWGGGTNYIIGSNASNYVKIATNSSDALTIDSSQNCNIPNGSLMVGATTAPSKTLDVEGNIRAKNAGGTSAAEIDIMSGATWRFRSNATSGTNSYGLDIVKGSAGTDVKMSIDSSGNATFSGSVTADGTASSSAPKYTFSGDTNTGLGYIGTDAVGLIAAGSRKFYVNSTTAYFQNLSGGVNVSGSVTADSLTVDTSAGQLDVEALGGSSVKVKSDGSLKIEATGGAVDLLHGSAEVLNTLSDGISVPNISVADDIRHTGDSDTYLSFENNYLGMYTNGKNTIALNDGSVNIANGGLMIGATTAPTTANSNGQTLVLSGSGNTGMSIVSGTSSNSSIMFADGTGGTAGYRGHIKYNHADDSLNFATAATASRLVINSSGNAEFSGSVTASTSMLVGDGEAYGFGDNSYRIEGKDDGTNARIGFVAGGTERMRLTSTGLGIGTLSPAQLCEIKETSTSTGVHFPLTLGGSTHVAGYAVGIALDPEGYGDRNKIAIVAEGRNQGWSRGKLHFLLDAVNDSGQATLSESKMVIEDNGSVGIGNNSPSSNHANANNLVVGDGTSGGIANYVGTGTGWYAFSRANANNSDAFDGGISYDGNRNLMFHTNAGSERLRIDGQGLIKFGGNLYGQLQQDGNSVLFRSNYSGSEVHLMTHDGNEDIHLDPSGYIKFEAAGVERLKLRSDGYVDMAGASDLRLTLGSQGTAGNNDSNWIRGNGNALNFNSAVGDYVWEVGGSPKMRLKSGGDLLVGKSSADNTTAGTRIHPLGYASFTIANDYPIIANRLSSNGDIAVFRKDGATVGSIGTSGGQSYIHGAGTDAGLYWGSNNIYPYRSTGLNDATIDLGQSGKRFKDLYITGLDVTYSTYNKISSYFSGSYTSGFKFSDMNGGIWYDAGTDDLTVSAGHANSQLILESGGSPSMTLLASGEVVKEANERFTIKSHSNSWDGGLRMISQDGTDTFQIHPDNNGWMYVDKIWNFTGDIKINGDTVIGSNRALSNISNAYITNGGALHNYTSSGSLRGYIQAVETGGGTAAGLVIATSGGETISFKDGGLSGTLNAEITGGGDLNLITGTLDINGTTVIDASRNVYANYSLLGRGFRAANRGELHLNATGANDVSEIFFGYGDGYTDAKIRWGISDRGTSDGNLVIYRGPALGGFNEVATFNKTTQDLSVLNGYRVNGTTVIDASRNANFNGLRINAGTTNYNSHTDVDEYLVQIQDSYDAAGSHSLNVVNWNGNWVDGTSGADSAYGLHWGYETSTRAGIHYDHRGSEKFDFYSSYGAIRFRLPASASGNLSPISGSYNDYLTISPGGAVEASANIRAPIFYDSGNTGYYVDPASTSISGKFRQTVIVGDGSQLNSNDGSWGARLNLTDSVHSKIEIGQDANSVKSSWWVHTGHDKAYFGTSTNHHLEFQTSGTTRLKIDKDGGATTTGIHTATGSFRAPIFYDSNDTNYYVNPASASVMGSLSLHSAEGLTKSHAKKDHWVSPITASNTGGTRETQVFRVYYCPNHWTSDPINLEVELKSKYYDNFSASYSISQGYSQSEPDVYLKHRATNQSHVRLKQGASTSAGFNYSGQPVYYTDFYIYCSSYATAWVELTATSGFSTSTPSGWGGTVVNNSNSTYTNGTSAPARIEPNFGASGMLAETDAYADSFRAPIFYDSNNTAYYVDPASTSNTGSRMRGGMLFGPNTSWNEYLYVGGNGNVSSYASVASTNGNLHLDGKSGQAVYLAWYTQTATYVGGDIRAQLYYDRDNTAYYVDPASTSISFKGQGVTDSKAGFKSTSNPWNTSNSAFFPNGITTNNTTNWIYGHCYLGNAPSNGNGNEATAAGTIESTSWHKATLYYDRDNTGFYFDGSSTSTSVRIAGDILCDQNYGKGMVGVYSSTRYQHVWSMGAAYRTSADGTSAGNMYGLTYTHPNVGTGTNQSISGLSHQLQHRHNGTLTAAIGSGIWTSGNVTAYSDIAVKTNLEVIPNALEKVCSINGYTYERTDYVKDLEDPEAPDVLRQAGVVAQEIEKVLPEVVSGQEGNKAVAYGNVVALLIESIKELKSEVDDLKTQLSQKEK